MLTLTELRSNDDRGQGQITAKGLLTTEISIGAYIPRPSNERIKLN